MSRVQVIIEESATPGYFFVEITGIPLARTLVVGNARPLSKAQKLKAKVEQALRDFEKPVLGEVPPQTTWDRLVAEDETIEES